MAFTAARPTARCSGLRGDLTAKTISTTRDLEIVAHARARATLSRTIPPQMLGKRPSPGGKDRSPTILGDPIRSGRDRKK